jgi:hypothetical protein
VDRGTIGVESAEEKKENEEEEKGREDEKEGHRKVNFL